MKWNEMKWKCGDLKCVQKPTRGRLSLTLTRTAVEHGPRVRVISPVEKEKVYGGKDLLKSLVLSSEWNSEQEMMQAVIVEKVKMMNGHVW